MILPVRSTSVTFARWSLLVDIFDEKSKRRVALGRCTFWMLVLTEWVWSRSTILLYPETTSTIFEIAKDSTIHYNILLLVT
jgi:hypothetical protein